MHVPPAVGAALPPLLIAPFAAWSLSIRPSAGLVAAAPLVKRG